MMKQVCMLMPVAVCALLTGCQSSSEVEKATAESLSAAANGAGAFDASTKPKDYVALPGMAATSATPSETDAAFNAAAAVLTSSAPQEAAQATALREHASIEPAPLNPDPEDVMSHALASATFSGEAGSESPGDFSLPEQVVIENTAPTDAAPPAAEPAAIGGEGAGYALQVTNGTTGRLFIEVQDASGNIFPFGFMYANQRLSSQPQEPKPIEGELTLVIRDPDKPGAPEVRRYHVPHPPSYMGKTVDVTILPGRFRAAVDGVVYYSSALPEDKAPAAPVSAQ